MCAIVHAKPLKDRHEFVQIILVLKYKKIVRLHNYFYTAMVCATSTPTAHSRYTITTLEEKKIIMLHKTHCETAINNVRGLEARAVFLIKGKENLEEVEELFCSQRSNTNAVRMIILLYPKGIEILIIY